MRRNLEIIAGACFGALLGLLVVLTLNAFVKWHWTPITSWPPIARLFALGPMALGATFCASLVADRR